MLPPEAHEFLSEMFSYLLTRDHSDCTPPENNDSNKIIVFVNGRHASKHHHLAHDVDLDVEDIIGIDDACVYRIIGIAISTMPHSDDLLTVYVAVEIATSQLFTAMLNSMAAYLESTEADDTTVHNLEQALSFLIPTSDQMKYTPPPSQEEADKEMEEWNKILHPERYTDPKGDS